MNILLEVLETIKRFLLPEIVRLEGEVKLLLSMQQDILARLSSLQAEVSQLKDRLSKVEARQESTEELMMLKLENRLLKSKLVKLLGRK